MTAEPLRRSSWAVWFAWALVLLAIYILSVGPALWIMDKAHVDPNGGLYRLFEVFYTPLGYAAGLTGNPGRDILIWYISQFVPVG